MTSDTPVEVVPFEPAHAPELAELFDRADNACYCRYFHFAGDKYAWQDRLANAPALNRRDMLEAACVASPEVQGVIARQSKERRAVGWMKVTPSGSLDKLYQGRLYRGLPCFDRPTEGVYTFGCFFIDPEFRGQGLAQRLVQVGIELVKGLGGRSIEALPRGDETVPEPERWLGRPSLFADAGFRVVHDFAPYPVLRFDLAEHLDGSANESD